MAKTKSADETKAAKAKRGAEGDAPAGKAAKGKADAKAVSSTRRAPAPADPPAVKEASVSPRGRKAAAAKEKSGAAAAKKPKAAKVEVRPGVAAADARKASAELRSDLRAFAAGRPHGWNHADWLSFLEHLEERGHDTADADAIGMALENERLAVVLEGVQGMGPRRVDAVVDRFRTLWSLRHADVDQIASVPGMNLSLAEKVRQAVH